MAGKGEQGSDKGGEKGNHPHYEQFLITRHNIIKQLIINKMHSFQWAAEYQTELQNLPFSV